MLRRVAKIYCYKETSLSFGQLLQCDPAMRVYNCVLILYYITLYMLDSIVRLVYLFAG